MKTELTQIRLGNSLHGFPPSSSTTTPQLWTLSKTPVRSSPRAHRGSPHTTRTMLIGKVRRYKGSSPDGCILSINFIQKTPTFGGRSGPYGRGLDPSTHHTYEPMQYNLMRSEVTTRSLHRWTQRGHTKARPHRISISVLEVGTHRQTRPSAYIWSIRWLNSP